MKKLFFGCLCVAAFIFVIGSVGALDNNSITFLQCAIQVAIGVTVEWFALKNMDK